MPSDASSVCEQLVIRDRDDLAAATAMLVADFFDAATARSCRFIALENVLLTALRGEPLKPTEAATVVASFLAHAVEVGDFAEESLVKAAAILARFATYVERRYQVADVRDIERDQVLAFLYSQRLGVELRDPAPATWNLRRWACGTFFRTLRQLGLLTGDPLLDVHPQQRGAGRYRPLSWAEVDICRFYARRATRDQYGPAAFACAEASATSGEIPKILVADVDLERAVVWIAGTRKSHARWGHLTDWGHRDIAQLIADRGDEPGQSLVRGGRNLKSSQSAVSERLSRTLDRAGFADDPTVAPTSIRYFAALRAYEDTGDLFQAQHALGIRSLDAIRDILDVPHGHCDLPPVHRKRVA